MEVLKRLTEWMLPLMEIVALMGPNGAGNHDTQSHFGLAPMAGGSVLWHEKPFAPAPHKCQKWVLLSCLKAEKFSSSYGAGKFGAGRFYDKRQKN